MANEDYRRLAEWADLPERIAYFQARTKEGRPAVLIVIVPGIAIPAPVTRLWNELPIPATAVSNERWRGTLTGLLPEQVVLHDRTAHTAFICDATEADKLLLPCIRWRVPGR